MDDPDAIWKPGYDGPVPTVEPDTDVADDSPPQLPADPRRTRPARSRWLGLSVALVVVFVGAIVMLDPLGGGDEPGVAGPGDRRLPQRATELWSVEIADVGDHRLEVIGRELVVAAIEEQLGSGTTLVAFDALTGEQRWAVPLDARPNDVTADMATGETRSPGDAGSLIPVSGSNFVTTAPGSISGVVVDGETQRVVWSRNDGAVVDQHPIDGGTLLQVATRGGAGMELVDGLTGRTVENLAMVPGALQALVVTGDGIVVLRPAAVGTRLVAIDLDGTERWSILGSEPVVVGDRIVARATSIDGQLRISVYGDAE